MLKHEVMAADEWRDNGPQDFQIANDKTQLSLLSVAYACPYHNPTTTLFTKLTSANHSPTHAVYHLTCTVETGIHPRRAHFSSVPEAIEGAHLLKVGYDADLQLGQDPGEDNKHADELP